MGNLSKTLQESDLDGKMQTDYFIDVVDKLEFAKRKAELTMEEAMTNVENIFKDMIHKAGSLKLKSDSKEKKQFALSKAQYCTPAELLEALGIIFTEEEEEEIAIEKAKVEHTKILEEIKVARNLIATNNITKLEEVKELRNPKLIQALYNFASAKMARLRLDHISEFLFEV